MKGRLFAKVLFAGSVVTSCLALDGRATAQQQPAQCCTPSQLPIVTAATGWTVQPPGGATIPAPVLSAISTGWSPAIGQSHWIGNTAGAGTNGQPPGDYIYIYRFCLCALPAGLAASAGAMFLSILSDNEFTAYLNATGPFMQGGSASFSTPTTGMAPGNAFVSGWNTLRIVVHNEPKSKAPHTTATGLDVSGWVAGYFAATCSNRIRPNEAPMQTQRSRPGKPPR